MKRWALVVALLYLLVIVTLTIPVILASLLPDMPSQLSNASGMGEFADGYLRLEKEVYSFWPYWVWVAVMVLGQAALLVVPVKIAERRPVTRRSLALPVLTAGLMMGGLVIGAFFSLYEFVTANNRWGDWVFVAAPGVGILTWCIWTIVFYRLARNADASDVVSRQCRLLLQGSILELLVAVPTHIIARSRNYCCAGFMTFIGITLGISVMLFSYGPAVFFLYADRWRRLHPPPDEAQ